MIDTNHNRVLASQSKPCGSIPDPTRGMVLQIIQSSANDNLMPTTKWFTRLILWTIVVGGALAYAIF